ncbi:MAG: sigma-70 family RNA polymerase sigma factor [Chloroflexales bacterium]|nr:sigma-70 family RNA polymerase sigma factor [Chloroflexales bacterium]
MFWPFSRREPAPGAGVAPPASALETLDDPALLSRARAGDTAAFGLLYQRHRMRVYRYIAYRTERQDVAEDLTAEVFLNAWRSVARLQERGASVRSWFLRLAHNEVVDYYRTRHGEASLPDDGPLMPTLDGPASALELQLEQATLLRAVRRLSAEWQQLILLRFVEDLSFEEIGVVLGKQSNACRQMQHRALARLRVVLAEEEERGDG